MQLEPNSAVKQSPNHLQERGRKAEDKRNPAYLKRLPAGISHDERTPTNNSHVESLDSLRGCFLFSTWRRNNSSEVSFHSSEVLFRPHVGNALFLRGDLQIPTWGSFRPSLGTVSSQRGWEILVPSVWDGPSGLFTILYT